MKHFYFKLLLYFLCCIAPDLKAQKTVVSVAGDKFLINGKPTYQGRTWENHSMEGLLMNSRMVQGIFDNLSANSVDTFAYADTKVWDAERNTNEFISNMSLWKSYGLNAFTLNMQGGSPFGYGNFDFQNPGYNTDGSLHAGYMKRLEKIINKADELEMVVFLGFFYFGQDQRLQDEKAVINATQNMTNWLLEKGYKNVLIEINNETLNDLKHYDHEILLTNRVHELMLLVKNTSKNGQRLLVSTSFPAQIVPTENVISNADFILFHCNALRDTQQYINHIAKVKSAVGTRKMPLVINEDDNYDFDNKNSHLNIALREHISWGYFDYRRKGETDLQKGYQSIPVDWGINSQDKKAFFYKLREITGGL